MPFADICRVITCFGKIMCNAFGVCWKSNIVSVAAVLSCINAALQTGAHGTADRLTGKCIFKKSAFLGKLVKVRRYGKLLSVAAC